MSEARDPRADDTNFIPPDGPATDAFAGDSAASANGVDAPSMAPTLDLNPGECGPAVNDTMVALAPTVDEKSDMPSVSVGETLDTHSSVGSKTASGSRATDAGFETMDVVADSADDATADDATTEPGSAGRRRRPGDCPGTGRRVRSDWPCRATRSSRRSAGAAWAWFTRPGISGWIALSR